MASRNRQLFRMKQCLHVILLLLTTCFVMVGSSSYNCRHAVAVASRTVATANESGRDNVCAVLASDTDCALPAQVQRIQLNVTYLTAHQQIKRLSESVFGYVANAAISYSLTRRIVCSRTFLRSLETYDIGFPFSSFW